MKKCFPPKFAISTFYEWDSGTNNNIINIYHLETAYWSFL